jgi:ferredoxin-fold anticodon binding domain-containing protein
MKKLVQVIEEEGQGLEALLGKKVAVFCLNYIYAGTLTGVNKDDIILSEAGIVYETGPLKERGYKDWQALPGNEWRVRTSCIESYGEME